MKPILLVSVLLAGTVAATSAGLAESAYGRHHPRIHDINSRLRAQAARIEHALMTGRISATRAAALKAEDASIKAEEKTDERFDRGHLTEADKRALAQQLDTVSRQIAPRPRVHEINARLHAQDARIDHALATGQITAEQAAALHARDTSIATEEKTDESFDKGHLTAADDRALNQQLDKVSREIADEAHPRIAEVNARLDAQAARIDRVEVEGKITAAQAIGFEGKDAAIKSEETTETSLDGGHLTRADQRSLNQQISSVGHAVGNAAGTNGSRGGSQASGQSGSHGGSQGGGSQGGSHGGHR